MPVTKATVVNQTVFVLPVQSAGDPKPHIKVIRKVFCGVRDFAPAGCDPAGAVRPHSGREMDAEWNTRAARSGGRGVGEGEGEEEWEGEGEEGGGSEAIRMTLPAAQCHGQWCGYEVAIASSIASAPVCADHMSSSVGICTRVHRNSYTSKFEPSDVHLSTANTIDFVLLLRLLFYTQKIRILS